MSREKQIEEMAWDLCDIPKHPSIKSCEQCGNKRCHAMYYAERAYNADYRKQSEWISAEERLPDNYRAVLVACEYTTIGGGARIVIGSYGGGFWSLADADGTHYLTKYMHAVVTHWMELPKAPKMTRKEDENAIE